MTDLVRDLPLIGSPQNPQSGPAAEITAPIQRGRPFEAGQSGNPTGRPKGSRNRLTSLFLDAIAADFGQHGMSTLATLRENDPAAYLKIICMLLPKKLILEREEEPYVNYDDLSLDDIAGMVETERKRQFALGALRAVRSS